MDSLFDFLKSLLSRFRKDEVIETLRRAHKDLNEIAIPCYASASIYFEDKAPKSEQYQEVEKLYKRNYDGKKPGNRSNMISNIEYSLRLCAENTKYTMDLAEQLLENDIITEALTAKKAVLLKAANSFAIIADFAPRLMNYILAYEAIANNAELDESFSMSKKDAEEITEEVINFAILLSDYAITLSEYKKLIGEVPEVVVNGKTSAMLSGVHKSDKLNPFNRRMVQSNLDNPIFNFRMFFARIQIERHSRNVELKKQLEQRLLFLKAQDTGETNPAIERQIMVLQSRIEKLEAKIRDVEEDLGINRK